MNPLSLQMPKPARRSIGILLLLGLVCGCAAPQIGGPTAPRNDPDAGRLTLPSGRSYPVYPDALAYTGVAAYRWPDGREYEGNWLAGRPDGLGVEQRPDGEGYRGTWRNGMRSGHGELTGADGTRYVGDFAANLRSGFGSERTDSGIYTGEWADDLPNGNGEYFGNNGSSYKGQWRNGEREGQGIYADGGGNSYEGDWAADAPNGFGRMEGAEGTVYQGQLIDGKRDGYGRLDAGGFIYEGTWKAGKRHGHGRVETPDGGSYVGGWQNDNRHGLGRATNADGSYHDGEWVEDQPLGPGTRVDGSGIEISGVWNGDTVTSGIVLLPTGASYAGRLMGHDRSVAPRFVSWLTTEAGTGDPYAQLFLGNVLSDYLDPAPQPEQAQALFLAAAQQGLAEAAYRAALGMDASAAAQTDAANQRIRLLTQAAQAGYAPASARLGEYYATGSYIPRDTSVAVTYFTQASEAGDLDARNNLAWILATYPDPMIRDGDQALALIRPLVLLYDNWRHLDTMAAAYAELGDFQQAVSTQTRALMLAERSAVQGSVVDATQLAHMRERLQLYQQDRSFRESAQSPVDDI